LSDDGEGGEDGDDGEQLLPASDSAAALLQAAARMVAYERLTATCGPVRVPASCLLPANVAAEFMRSPGSSGGGGGGHQQRSSGGGGGGGGAAEEGGDEELAAPLPERAPHLGVVRIEIAIGPVRVRQMWEQGLAAWRQGQGSALVWR
jgi:hypothetical protein